jgi:hypothetical protein
MWKLTLGYGILKIVDFWRNLLFEMSKLRAPIITRCENLKLKPLQCPFDMPIVSFEHKQMALAIL